MTSLAEFAEYLVPFTAIITALALGWAISRSQALNAWKSAAEGYKAQRDEMEGRLDSMEEKTKLLIDEVALLEARPDMSAVMKELAEIKEALGDISTRW